MITDETLSAGGRAPETSLAVEAVRRARAWFDVEGDPDDFRAFEAFVLFSSDARTYAEVAEALGMTAPDVRRRVQRVRERVRAELQSMLQAKAPGGT
jgi:DNA-directed RNA polymerase specialized sigma24 family protein